MIESKKFKNKKTGEIATQIPLMEIGDWEEYEDELKNEPKYTNEKDLVIYELGSTSLITRLTDCLKCIYTGKQYFTDDKRIMTLDEASSLIDKEQAKRYNKEWVEVSAETYDDMLNCLPPKKWENFKEEKCSIFAMSEFTEGVYTQHFVRYKDKYYSATRDFFRKNEELIAELLIQLTNAEARV